jgi:hypothetical protein
MAVGMGVRDRGIGVALEMNGSGFCWVGRGRFRFVLWESVFGTEELVSSYSHHEMVIYLKNYIYYYFYDVPYLSRTTNPIPNMYLVLPSYRT